jgi:hypothetical protein
MDLDVLADAMRSASAVPFTALREIPATSGIYTAWQLDETACFYVGKATRLSMRIRSHYSGQRGSDQFCLYVYDRCLSGRHESRLLTSEINWLTACWVREHVVFRWVDVPLDELTALEIGLRRAWKPILNPLG